MANIKLTPKMKRHTVIIALKGEHNDFEITYFLKVAQSFFIKIFKKLDAINVTIKTVKGPNIIRTPKFA